MAKYNGEKYLKVLEKEILEFGIVPAAVIALIRKLSSYSGTCYATSKSLSKMLGLKGRAVEYHLKILKAKDKISSLKINGKRHLFIKGEYNPERIISETKLEYNTKEKQPAYNSNKEYIDSNGEVQKRKPNPFLAIPV